MLSLPLLILSPLFFNSMQMSLLEHLLLSEACFYLRLWSFLIDCRDRTASQSPSRCSSLGITSLNQLSRGWHTCCFGLLQVWHTFIPRQAYPVTVPLLLLSSEDFRQTCLLILFFHTPFSSVALLHECPPPARDNPSKRGPSFIKSFIASNRCSDSSKNHVGVRGCQRKTSAFRCSEDNR